MVFLILHVWYRVKGGDGTALDDKEFIFIQAPFDILRTAKIDLNRSAQAFNL
ncbi:hypothetical protein SBF1_1230003 [Candidatus Desulfosporosinus infrequens]|uniref:Uncharacterized protein n=1 Tax=Candidatus Desulfosporosinus infrequens TaxID=2043169 RepID=A0A2U3K1T7_9FIRM|nr:hypothetical protein SBF1_1230003 [Candidatus Desulfosporosinus infrequens]